ncbi:phosphotransferase [Reinekea forsetii]|nr:phosphotransferase [Reinekea forsetii]
MLLDHILRELTDLFTENISIKRLESSLTNRLYQLESPNGQFAVRINSSKAKNLGIDRDREIAILQHLQSASWCLHPELATADYLVTPWISALPLSVENDLDCILNLLKHVHHYDITALTASPLDITLQLARLQKQSTALSNEFSSTLKDYTQAYQLPEILVLCHHDWHVGNLYKNNTGLLLNDWEYAAPGDPLVDIACFILGFNLDLEQRSYCLNKLGISHEQLQPLLPLVEAMSILWYQVRFPKNSTAQKQQEFVNKWSIA